MFFGKNRQIITEETKVEEVLNRSVSEIIDKENLKKKMLGGAELRIKLGIDPTSPNLHLGRSVPLLKLRDFQELGHHAVLIIGDATGVVGDTSDKDSERPMLTREKVKKNKETYLEQAAKILNMEKVEVRHNSEWLDELRLDEIGKQADQFSVSDFIARDNIKRRLDVGKRVSLREMMYPLMQGYDSVAVKADVELGGVDQRFNLLAGRTLQEYYNQPPQHVVMTTFPIEGTDGRKMSSSWGNTINFNDKPNDMYGKIMRINDDLVYKYFELTTRVSTKDIEKIMSTEKPRDSKMRLALEVVGLYHDKTVAEEAQRQFIQTFSEKGMPDDIPTVTFVGSLQETIVSNKIASSNSEWSRLVESGAVKNAETGGVVRDKMLNLSRDMTLKIGKRRFVKIKAN